MIPRTRSIIPALACAALLMMNVETPQQGNGEQTLLTLGRSAQACGFNLGCWKMPPAHFWRH